jgi:hypothetical protein
MNELDNFGLNIAGVSDLIGSPENKVADSPYQQEGIVGDEIDILELDMSNEELITLKHGYEEKYAPYDGKYLPRVKQNKAYLLGIQRQTGLNNKTIPSNLLFEATATFVPQALAKNPEPVVFSDNTEEGKLASNDVKTVLQFLAMTLGLRKLLGLMVWHWSIYFNAVMKYGWDTKTNQIRVDIRKRKNFLLDPDGYVNVFGEFIGWLGERIQSTAQELVDEFPGHKEYIATRVGGKMGTLVIRTEWWTDDYCFTTYEEEILDKHKNEFFNYEEDKTNHYAIPKKPYTFLSVFNLQEQPDDFTNLIEQNIANQDRINARDGQIEKNLAHGNNAILMDEAYFTSETAHQGADAIEQGDPILAPKGSVERLPANPLPEGILNSQEIDKETLRSIYGTQGLSANTKPDQRVRNNILNQEHDNSRIGGGMGDSLETVAQSFFNWMLQMTYVFYDEKHYAAIMGQASAVEYVGLMMVGHERQYVVSVQPDSMSPKDEISEQNMAIERWSSKAIDPIGFMKAINDPDPVNSAKRLVLWTINPQQYLATYFPELGQQPDSTNTQNPPDIQNGVQGGGESESLSAPPASGSLSQVPINQGTAQPKI